MSIWIAALILIISMTGIYVLSKQGSKAGNRKIYTMVMLLLGALSLAVSGYLLLSAIFLRAIAT